MPTRSHTSKNASATATSALARLKALADGGPARIVGRAARTHGVGEVLEAGHHDGPLCRPPFLADDSFDRSLEADYQPMEWPPSEWRLKPEPWPAPWGWALGNALEGRTKAEIRHAYAAFVAEALVAVERPEEAEERHERLRRVHEALAKAINLLHEAYDGAGGADAFCTSIRRDVRQAGHAAYHAKRAAAGEVDSVRRSLLPKGRKHRHDGLVGLVAIGLKAHGFTQGEVAHFVQANLKAYWQESVVKGRGETADWSIRDAKDDLTERIKKRVTDYRGDLPPALSPRKRAGRKSGE